MKKKFIVGQFILLFNLVAVGQSLNAFEFDFKTFTSKDTLLLISEVRDCGEFGGHNEYITIYFDGQFTATLKRDKLCKPELKYNDPDKPYKRKITLTAEFQEDLLIFINEFKKYQDNPDQLCNAPSYNSIKYRKQFIILDDNDCKWKGFKIFRDKLFKNDN